MGTGNALMLVEPFVDNQPFVVAYPDDIVLGVKPLSNQLIETWAVSYTHLTLPTILLV